MGVRLPVGAMGVPPLERSREWGRVGGALRLWSGSDVRILWAGMVGGPGWGAVFSPRARPFPKPGVPPPVPWVGGIAPLSGAGPWAVVPTRPAHGTTAHHRGGREEELRNTRSELLWVYFSVTPAESNVATSCIALAVLWTSGRARR